MKSSRAIFISLAVFGLAVSVTSAFCDTSASDLQIANRRLRKISLHLRGITPTSDEYDSMAKSEDPEAFIQKQIIEYQKSPSYVEKMNYRIDEMLRLKTQQYWSDDLSNTSVTSCDLLVTSLTKDNLSWDTLLTGKQYFITPEPQSAQADIGFYSAVKPNLPKTNVGAMRTLFVNLPSTSYSYSATGPAPTPSYGPPTSVTFDPADPRVAGVLTTKRFLDRYNTTNLNKNRGRAAAVFRTFLCDDMKPSVGSTSTDDPALINEAFGGKLRAMPAVGHATMMDERRHGTDPACMSCHYKLDPLGRSFMTSTHALSTFAAPGALVFNRPDGSQVSISGKGIGDVALAITKQPEYAQCQVKHFWSWFVGDDIPISSSKMDFLVQEFDRVGRKTNDFVTVMLNQPEFNTQETASVASAPQTKVTFGQVKPLLAKCMACHQQSDATDDFTTLPIGGNGSAQDRWLNKISKEMDLDHDGLNPTMPPKDSPWQPTKDEIQLLKSWINQGAHE